MVEGLLSPQGLHAPHRGCRTPGCNTFLPDSPAPRKIPVRPEPRCTPGDRAGTGSFRLSGGDNGEKPWVRGGLSFHSGQERRKDSPKQTSREQRRRRLSENAAGRRWSVSPYFIDHKPYFFRILPVRAFSTISSNWGPRSAPNSLARFLAHKPIFLESL